MERLGLGFLASNRGSNMQAIINACSQGRLEAQPRVTISNNSGSVSLRRAKIERIPAYHLSQKTHPQTKQLDLAIMNTLVKHNVDIVILAGYMKMLGPVTVSRFRGRILNIHPSLLPKFGGKGLYGTLVHEAVIAAGERTTGATIHLVDEKYDNGPIIAQSIVPVTNNDTAITLAERVLKQEHALYVDTLQRIVQGEIDLPGFSRRPSS